MNIENSTALVTLLAMVDAVFRPIRRPFSNRDGRGVARIAQAGYARIGAPFVIVGTEADRRARARAIADLDDGGMVRQIKKSGLKSTNAILTTAGEATARLMIALPSLADGLAVLPRLQTLTAGPLGNRDNMGGRYINEWPLANERQPAGGITRENRLGIFGLELSMLPLINRGIVVARSCYMAAKSICYACVGTAEEIAAANREAAAQAEAPEIEIPDDAEYDALIELYTSTSEAESTRLAATDPGGEIGPLPLPTFNPDAKAWAAYLAGADPLTLSAGAVDEI